MATWLRMSGVVLAGAAVALGVAGCGGTAGAASPATTSTTAPTSSASTPRRAHDGVAGQISAENGSSWLITTKDGKQVTVLITSGTRFGTAAKPATAQQFPVGATIRVTGAVAGNTVTAARIVTPQPRSSTSPTPTPTS